jgi:CRP-like cAMP-binding protein
MVKSRPASSVRATRPKNQLLAALPPEVFSRIAPHLQTVPTYVKQVLQKQGAPIEFVYFLNGGVGSMTTVLEGGTMVEAATVGDEGMLGIEVFFQGDAISSGQTILQVPDTDAERMGARAFRDELALHGAFHDLIGRYARVTMAQMMQSTACNASHNVHERCARWLLQTYDRMHQQDFHLSHEFLGVMLGVRRQTVSIVAGTLQKAGLIRYSHGHVMVLNRKGLEDASCECYQVIRKHYATLTTA